MRVAVIPTRAVVQTLAAVAMHDPAATFDDDVVAMTRAALMAYSVGLIGLIAVKVLAPGFYARQDIRTPVKIALVAFGDEALQSLLFFIFTYALEPTLVYSAFIKPPSQREFEMVILSKKQVDPDEIESFTEKLKMSICVIPFDKYMSSDMLESLNRLHYRGQMKIGNFQTDAAERVRRCFYYHLNKKKKQDLEREVLLATGYTFTPRNMIELWNMYRQERVQNEVRRIAREAQGPPPVFEIPLIHAWHSTPESPVYETTSFL
jgi:hypothetical protein